MSGDGAIRVCAQAVVRDGERILVFEGHDPVKRETFYRPLGGGVEFGESAADAVRRELVEETGVAAGEVRHLATVENIFVHDGNPGHEVVFLFDVELAGELPATPFTVLDSGDKVLWMPLSAFDGDGAPPLYPHGLLELLR